MTDPTDTPTPAALSPERLAEIKDLLEYESSIAFYSHRAKESLLLLVADDERLRAELDRTRTELAKYVGHEPTLTEEALYAHEEKVRERIAADLVAWCPDHGSRDTSFMDCHCPAADEVRGSTNARTTTAGGTR